MNNKSNKAFTYIVECATGQYYTGYTTDVVRRVNEHNTGVGAKYTKSRRPVKLVFCKEFNSKSEAMKYECYVKSLTRSQKIDLIKDYQNNK